MRDESSMTSVAGFIRSPRSRHTSQSTAFMKKPATRAGFEIGLSVERSSRALVRPARDAVS